MSNEVPNPEVPANPPTVSSFPPPPPAGFPPPPPPPAGFPPPPPPPAGFPPPPPPPAGFPPPPPPPPSGFPPAPPSAGFPPPPPAGFETAGGAMSQTSFPAPPPGLGSMGPMSAPVGGATYASWGSRVGAYFLDAILLLPIYVAIFVFGAILAVIPKIGGALSALVFIVGYLGVLGLALYLPYLTGQKGASPGKRILGIQVVNQNTGQFIGGGMGIVRSFAHMIDALPCYLGFLLPLVDSKKQTIADKVLSTIVINGPQLSFGDAIKEALPAKFQKR